MIIHADICSKAFKRREFNKLAQKNGWGLHNFVGALHLDAYCTEEIEFLSLLYRLFFSGRDDDPAKEGRLVIFDENDVPVFERCPRTKEIKFVKKKEEECATTPLPTATSPPAPVAL